MFALYSILQVAVVLVLIPQTLLAQGCNELLRGGVFDSFNESIGHYSSNEWLALGVMAVWSL